jgi:hypothetical protein
MVSEADSSWDNTASKDLIVKSGKIKRISPGSIRHYRNFVIESGGILKIDSGTQKFTHIKVSGEFILNGIITAKSFRSGGGSFSETAPDGEDLFAQLDEENSGGKGGRGGSRSSTYGPTKRGGYGTSGTKNYGGGGGSGAGSHPNFKGKPRTGVDASGRSGGISTDIDSPGGKGGDGAARGNNINGGYIYFNIAGKIIAWNGLVDASGSKGAAGEDGRITGGGGGGGGGSPGGHGGVIVIKYLDNLGDVPVQLNGGDGGDGGIGGGQGSRYSRPRWGENGKQGEQGKPGYLEEI